MALVWLLCAGQADAATKFRYTVVVKPVTYDGAAAGSVYVQGLDTLKTTTLRVTRLGVQQYVDVNAAGATSASMNADQITSGDQIEVQQPTGTVQETFTVPPASLTGTPGSPVLTGHAPDGAIAFASSSPACFGRSYDDFVAKPQGGNFSVQYARPAYPGMQLELTVYPGKGDTIRFLDRIPGETPCFSVDAVTPPAVPGEAPYPTPYRIQVSSTLKTVATGARIVLRRGGGIVFDYSDPTAVSGIYGDFAVKPQPGDLVELYRPQGAGAPSATFTIPSVTTTYDPTIGLVAVDAPAALTVEVGVNSLAAMWGATRGARDTAPGRTLLNFAAPQGEDGPIDLAKVGFISTEWTSPDGAASYTSNASLGDLLAPSLKLKIASKFKLKKLGTSIPLTITSSELATSKISVTLPAKLKTSASKSKKPRLIASAKPTLMAGANKLKIKLTKSGKKLLKSLRKKRAATQTATLTIVATDPSGNATTTVKSTKLAAR